jgi:hypothetical protein
MSRRAAVVSAWLLALIAVCAWWSWSSREEPGIVLDRTSLAADAATTRAPERVETEAGAPSAGTDVSAPVRTVVAEPATDRRLRVRVVDADRQPIEFAEVEAFADSTPGKARTDREGYARLPGPIRGDARRLFVKAGNRHAQAYWQYREDLTIVLKWAGPVLGRIVDRATGAAIPGAVVTRHHSFCKQCEADRAVADANGVFELPAVPRDEDCPFAFSAEGYASQYERLRIPGKGEPVTHTFSLQRGVVVSGRCVDLATRQPLAGTRVVKGGESLAESSADGSFHVLVLPEADGTVQLRFEHGGYCRVTQSVQAPQFDPVEHPLPRAATVAGRVVTPIGSPIVGARVSVILERPEGTVAGMPPQCVVEDEDYNRRGKTDATGVFAIDGLVPGGTYRMRAGHEDYEPPSDDRRFGTVVELKEGAPPCDLVLVPKEPANGLGSIVGTFRCNGESCAGQLEWSLESRHGRAAIDEGGTFRCERVPAGRVQVVVTPKAFEYASGPTVDAVRWFGSLDVAAAQEAKLDIDHRVAEATITGRITLADGTPVAGRWVWANEESGVRLFATSGDDGAYSLRLPMTIARVSLRCGGAPASREVVPGATGCDFVVARRGTLRVRIRDDDGAAADAQVAEITKDGDISASALTPAPDPDGFVVLQLDEGPHTLLFVDRGHAPCVREVNLAGTTSIDVALLRGVQVTLRLHAGADPLPEGSSVRVVDEVLANCRSLEFAHLWRLDARAVKLTREGASVQSLAPGTHRLVSRDPGIELEPSTFEVGVTPVTVDVKWRRRVK